MRAATSSTGPQYLVRIWDLPRRMSWCHDMHRRCRIVCATCPFGAQASNWPSANRRLRTRRWIFSRIFFARHLHPVPPQQEKLRHGLNRINLVSGKFIPSQNSRKSCCRRGDVAQTSDWCDLVHVSIFPARLGPDAGAWRKNFLKKFIRACATYDCSWPFPHSVGCNWYRLVVRWCDARASLPCHAIICVHVCTDRYLNIILIYMQYYNK